MAPNIFTAIFDGINSRIQNWAYGSNPREDKYNKTEAYYQGLQAQQIKVIKGMDDNLVTNYSRLVIDRGVSMLVGHGVEFYPPEETAKEWLDMVWDANKKDITLHHMAKTGGIYGTPFVKIIPESIEYDGALYPRISVQHPKYWEVFTAPEDIEKVTKYRMEFNAKDGNKEVTRREDWDLEDGVWWVREYVNRGGGFALLSPGEFGVEEPEINTGYAFPLIHHWQNLPQFGSVYGEADITPDIIGLQDRINYVSSNISKIIRLHGHPKTFGVGISNGGNISMGPDDMPMLPEGSDIRQLSYITDLSSASNYLLSLRQSMFDITRTVDISSMSDKLGALTNFGLHVLYQDALSKLKTKQELYGEAFETINRRLLAVGGFNPDPGEVEFGDALPESIVESVQAQKEAMNMGIQSKPGASQALKEVLGLSDYEEVQAEINEQNTNERAFGASLLDQFMQTGTTVRP